MTVSTVVPASSPDSLTTDQRRIVEFGDGPVVVIAGAGTGKTRVIVERVKWLLETRDGLLPENILVLTYNVKATRELQERLDTTVGTATRARIAVSNFHSFCHRILTENAADAGLPPRPDVLDGIGQVLLLRDIVQDAAAHLPLPLDVGSGRLRALHQPGEGRAGHARRLRCLRGRGATGIRGAVREFRGRRRPTRGEGQPEAAS